MAEYISNLLISNIDFGMNLSNELVKSLLRGHLNNKPSFKFTIYRNLSIRREKLGKFSDINKGQIYIKVKFQFFVKSAIFDQKPIYLIERLDVKLYKWTSKTHCIYTIRNCALIQKIMRLLSLKSTKASMWELFLLIIAPFMGNLPINIYLPQVNREHAFLSNLYFDELLLCIFADSQVSISLHRFKVTNNGYELYPGIVEGLAKPPASVIDYHKPNHFDLSNMPQEGLKYQLICAFQDSQANIKRYHNVKCISYEIRRDILGIGLCDVRFEIFVADAPHYKQKSMAEDMDISAANADLFFAAIATRISNILIHEIGKPEYLNKEVDLRIKRSDNPFNRPLHQDLNKPVRQDFTPMSRYFKPNVDVTLERAFQEYNNSGPSSKVSVGEILPKKMKEVSDGKKETLEKVVDKIQFVNKLLRMKGLITKDKDKVASQQRKRGDKAPKIFKENEVIMFKLCIYPTKSRSTVHKLVLSSTDILKMFNVSDFLIEGLGVSVLNWKTITWIAGMDSKTVFNYFCSFVCSRIIMKRWMIYKRPFFIYSKDITRHLYLHQNNFLLEEQKSTPKLLPFLSIQSLDLDFIFHKIVKHKGLFVIVSLVKNSKDKVFLFKAFVKNTCRTFTTTFKTDELQGPVEDFMSALMYLILCQHPSDLPTTLEDLMRSLERKLPKNKFNAEDDDLPKETEFKATILEVPQNFESESSKSSSEKSQSRRSLKLGKESVVEVMKFASSRIIRMIRSPRIYFAFKNHRSLFIHSESYWIPSEQKHQEHEENFTGNSKFISNSPSSGICNVVQSKVCLYD